jgi:hypothetical protein
VVVELDTVQALVEQVVVLLLDKVQVIRAMELLETVLDSVQLRPTEMP